MKNIETTIVSKSAITDKEDIFLETEGLALAEIAGTDWLRNLTNREIIGCLYHARGGCYYVKGPEFFDRAYRDCRRAAALAPENRFVKAQLALLENTIAANFKTEMIEGAR